VTYVATQREKIQKDDLVQNANEEGIKKENLFQLENSYSSKPEEEDANEETEDPPHNITSQQLKLQRQEPVLR